VTVTENPFHSVAQPTAPTGPRSAAVDDGISWTAIQGRMQDEIDDLSAAVEILTSALAAGLAARDARIAALEEAMTHLQSGGAQR
jgi:hypothetical protein